MLKVKIEKGGIEYAIKKLRNKVRKSKQIDKLREKKKYTKPCVKKRENLKITLEKVLILIILLIVKVYKGLLIEIDKIVMPKIIIIQ